MEENDEIIRKLVADGKTHKEIGEIVGLTRLDVEKRLSKLFYDENAYTETNAQEFGNSIGIIIPKHIVKFLDIEKGTKIAIIGKRNKHGQKHGSFWKKGE